MAQQNSSEEIDLGYLFRKVNDFFKSIFRAFFLVIDFFKRYFIVVIVLLIIGFGYGYYKDYNEKLIYNNEVIVIPNFDSVDYLYDKVAAINNKISARDTVYLNQVVGSNYKKLIGIKIEPIVDLYNFVSKNTRNYDVLKLIGEKEDVFEYMDDFSIGKYYKYHRLQISILGDDSSETIITDMLSYINKNEHFEEYQEVYIVNNKLKIREHYVMIAQIDSLLAANTRINSTSNVSIINSTNLFDLIDKKRQLLDALRSFEVEEVNFKVPIKKVSADYNLKTKRFLSLSNKIKYPLLLVFLFSMVFFVIYLFGRLRKYSRGV